ANDHEAPALTVASARRADREVQDLTDHRVRHWIGFDPAHRPLRGHGLEEFQSFLLAERLASVSLTPHRFGNILRRRAAGPAFFRRPARKEGLAMLTHDDNERVTQVGRGTPMGETMRRYWIPALLARELPEPDCAPVRVKLLGEELVAFRDTQGRI